MTTRRIWFWPVLLLLAGLASGWLWWWTHRMTPQIVTLPNGVAYRFVGVTYGTNHVMGPALARVIHKLPQPLRSLAGGLWGKRLSQLNSHTTSEPSFCVWFQPLGTNPPAMTGLSSIKAVLVDDHGVIAGEREYISLWFAAGGLQWLRPDFTVVPRRSPMLECLLFDSRRAEGFQAFGRVQFPNPVYGQYPQWHPEPLPAVKMAGDVLVRLKSFSTGHSNASQSFSQPDGPDIIRFRPARPGEDERAVFQLEFESPRDTNEIWTMNTASLSDATGNDLPASSRTETGAGYFAIGPVLWPDEAAWRLTLELERKTGFNPEELVAFKNVPVPAMSETNAPAWTNQIGEIQFVLSSFARRPDITGGSWSSSDASTIRIEHTRIPDGYSFDFVKAVADDGSKLDILSRGWSDTYYEISFRSIPTNTTALDVTYAYQKTRTVAFLVKPELVSPEEKGAGN